MSQFVDVFTLGAIIFFGFWMIQILIGMTCLRHEWMPSGKTKHMALKLDTGEFEHWEREWLKCRRCNARKRGKRIDHGK